MKRYIFIAVLIVSGLLQITILDDLKVFNVKLDLFLVTALSAAFFMNARYAVLFCFFCGLFKDIFVYGTIGINSILFCLWSAIIMRLSRHLTIDNNYVRTVIIFITALLNNIVLGVFVTVYLDKTVPIGIFLRIIILGALYSTVIFGIISSIIFLIWRWGKPDD
ncbi:MAG: hypothetical protein NC923_04735 [Candidatus Omnitrophica bacterium]|nr:hypothetical protein [Candidatus Omnitrophota bacterium]